MNTSFLNKIILVVSFFIVLPNVSYAQSTPEETVNKAMSELKEAGSLGPIVEFIDWDKMYMELSQDKKSVMKVSSPEELKDFNKRVLTSPSTEIASLLSSKINHAQRSIDENKMKAIVTKLEERLKQKELKIKEKITNTDYEVLSSSINADTAKVNLKQTYHGESKVDEVKMHKINDQWYFSSLSDLFSKSDLKGISQN